MATVKDFFDLMAKVNFLKEAFGATATFQQKYELRVQAIGREIAAEQGVPYGSDSCMSISEGAELGSESGPLLEELSDWLKSQHSFFQPPSPA